LSSQMSPRSVKDDSDGAASGSIPVESSKTFGSGITVFENI